MGSSWCASWFDLRFGIVFAPSSALLGTIFGLLWCHLRPSWSQCSVPGYRFGVFFWLFGSMFVCHLSMCFCSTFAFPFLDAACLFSICGCFAFALRFVHGALRARALRTARCAIKYKPLTGLLAPGGTAVARRNLFGSVTEPEATPLEKASVVVSQAICAC